MKISISLMLFMLISCCSLSQQKQLTQGYLELQLKYSAKSNFDLPPPPPPPPPGMELPQQENTAEFPDFGNDGFIIKIWFSPKFEKVVNSQYGRTTFLFNSTDKSTITLQENFGYKSGSIASQKDEAEINKYMDSLKGIKEQPINHSTVEYNSEEKTINGFKCKKALIITTTPGKINDTITVWYYPDYKLAENFYFSSDKIAHKSKLSILKLINGLPINVNLPVSPKTRLEIEVKKVDFKKPVPAKEFEVPKDFKLKSIKESYGLK